VSGSTFRGNEAGGGGAIEASGDTATVTRSTFTNNYANDGDGGAIEATNIFVTGSTFKDNDADDGGAIYADTATISSSRFTRNTAVDRGGAVYVNIGTAEDFPQLRRNTFSGNRAASGGAITLRSCGAIRRSLATRVERANRFSGNRATEQRRTKNIERREANCFG
jgi:predicted outer membrane repeat protein